MSDEGGGSGRNKTVFRPSPLQGLKQGRSSPPQPPAEGQGWDAPAPVHGGGYGFSPPEPQAPPSYPPADRHDHAPQHSGASGPRLQPSRLSEDDVPVPATPRKVRNIMLAEASPVLALAAGLRAGRVRMPLPQFHRQATESIGAFDRAIAPHYSEETRQRAKYALCATIDDIAQNLPGLGIDGAEWARRSLVVSFFRENIGGDRFWQLVDDMLRYPNDNLDLIELYHACLAAGFEGRFRVMPDGKRRLHEIMARLQGALEHVRSLSQVEISPAWRGEKAPLKRVGFWAYVGMAAAAAAALLFIVFVVLQLILINTGAAPKEAIAGIHPDDRLRLSREGGEMAPVESAQASRLRQFLQREIEQGLVAVNEDGRTVRVRTTVGQLFRSGDDQLEAGREELFRRIGQAIKEEPGPVLVEGHADSDPSSSLEFPDNVALSQARAETVASIIRGELADGERVRAEGLGDAQPIASNETDEGKSQNRRVEVVVQRRFQE